MRRAVIAAMAFTALAAGPGTALAEPPAVDVALHDPPPPRRYVVFEWNPVPLIFGKVTANLIVVPKQHHAFVLSPFYAWVNTEPVVIYDDNGNPTQLPQQHFSGGGCDLGYRYYFTRDGGPRGLFVGPTFLVGFFTATAMNGAETSYVHLGGAADLGYQILIADRVALSLVGGVQYSAPLKDIPQQQFPARIYANGGVLPRLFLTIGGAL